MQSTNAVSSKEVSKTTLPPVIILEGDKGSELGSHTTIDAVTASLSLLEKKGYNTICLQADAVDVSEEIKAAKSRLNAEARKYKMEKVVIEENVSLVKLVNERNVIIFFPRYSSRSVQMTNQLKCKRVYFHIINNESGYRTNTPGAAIYINNEHDIKYFLQTLNNEINRCISNQAGKNTHAVSAQTHKVVFINVDEPKKTPNLARKIQEFKSLGYVVFGFHERDGYSIVSENKELDITCFSVCEIKNLADVSVPQDTLLPDSAFQRQWYVRRYAFDVLNFELIKLQNVTAHILDKVNDTWLSSEFILKILPYDNIATVDHNADIKTISGVKTWCIKQVDISRPWICQYEVTVPFKSYASLSEAFKSTITVSELAWLNLNKNPTYLEVSKKTSEMSAQAATALTDFTSKTVGFLSATFTRDQSSAATTTSTSAPAIVGGGSSAVTTTSTTTSTVLSTNTISKTALPPVIILDGISGQIENTLTVRALAASIPMLAAKGYDTVCFNANAHSNEDEEFTAAEQELQAAIDRYKMKIVLTTGKDQSELTEVVSKCNGLVVFYPPNYYKIVHDLISNSKVKPIIYWLDDSKNGWVRVKKSGFYTNYCNYVFDDLMSQFFNIQVIQTGMNFADFSQQLKAKIDLRITLSQPAEKKVVNVSTQTEKVVFVNITNPEKTPNLASKIQELKSLGYVVFGFYEQEDDAIASQNEEFGITCFSVDINKLSRYHEIPSECDSVERTAYYRPCIITQSAQEGLGLVLIRLQNIKAYVLERVDGKWLLAEFTLKMAGIGSSSAEVYPKHESQRTVVSGVQTQIYRFSNYSENWVYSYVFSIPLVSYSSLDAALNGMVTYAERAWLNLNKNATYLEVSNRANVAATQAVTALTDLAGRAAGFFSAFGRGQTSAVATTISTLATSTTTSTSAPAPVVDANVSTSTPAAKP